MTLLITGRIRHIPRSTHREESEVSHLRSQPQTVQACKQWQKDNSNMCAFRCSMRRCNLLQERPGEQGVQAPSHPPPFPDRGAPNGQKHEG